MAKSAEGEEVQHVGRVTCVDEGVVYVQIQRSDACSSCKAASMCGVHSKKSQTVAVPLRAGEMYEEGQTVTVALKRSMGLKAVWVGYVLPLVIMVAVLLGGLLFLPAEPQRELYSGLCAIGAVALYYFVVWLMREKLNEEYVFYIK